MKGSKKKRRRKEAGSDYSGTDTDTDDAAGAAVLYNSSEIPGPNSKCKGKSKVLCTSPCFWDKDAKECASFTTETNLLHWPSPLALVECS